MKLSSLPAASAVSFKNSSAYTVISLLLVGNIVFPQLFHLIPGGGPVWLPIYFFTLIGAWAFGWRVGFATALLSPLVNSLLFGMPASALLPVIMIKGSVLAFIASVASRRFRRPSFAALAAVVLGYQVVGSLAEWAVTGSLHAACQDITLGIPGMLLQAVGGWILLRAVSARQSA